MTDPTTILVIGTRKGSFGGYIADALEQEIGRPDQDHTKFRIVRADLKGYDDELEWPYDVTCKEQYHREQMQALRPYHVVYAVGVNDQDEQVGATMADSVAHHMEVNVEGFLKAAQAFRQVALPGSHLVAISSNSARIPRSPSLGYCVSKAALSMAVRVLARRWRGEPVTYAYEPGLMNTQATIANVNADAYSGAAHRMRGVTSRYGLSAAQVAESVAHNLLWGGVALNGTLQQLDAGEL